MLTTLHSPPCFLLITPLVQPEHQLPPLGSNMAPSVLLPESPPPSFSRLAKQAPANEGPISLDAHAPVGGNLSFRAQTANGNGHSHESNGTGHAGRRLAGNEFITAQSLLQSSRAYGSQHHGQPSNGAPRRPNILYIMVSGLLLVTFKTMC